MNSITQYIKNDKQLIILIVIATFSLGLLAHAHSILNIFFNHDSLWLQHNRSFSFLDTHGRFFMRFYEPITGGLTLPWIHGIFSLIYMSLSTYFLVKIFDIKNSIFQVVLCGIIATAPILSFSYATYIFLADVHMFALLLSILAVYIFQRYNFLFAIPFIICSLGLYQAYVQVSTLLLLILIIKDIIDGQNAKVIFISGLKALFLISISMISYFIIIKYFNTQELASYRSYNSLGNFSDVNILNLLVNSYLVPLKELFIKPIVYTSTVTNKANYLGIFNFLLALLSLSCLMVTAIKLKIEKLNLAFLSLAILLIPFSMGFMYILVKAHPGPFAYYPIYFFFLLVIVCIEKLNAFLCGDAMHVKSNSIFNTIFSVAILCFAINIHSNIIFANQMYVYRDLAYTGSLSLMTRVAEKMEATEGFDPTKTKVLFIGDNTNNNPYDYKHLKNVYDPRNQIFIGGVATYALEPFFQNHIGYNIIHLHGNKSVELMQSDKVKNMPAFPDKDSIKMIDGVLVVKISKN